MTCGKVAPLILEIDIVESSAVLAFKEEVMVLSIVAISASTFKEEIVETYAKVEM